MLGHRDLTAEDYVGILKRRRWFIAIPTLAMPLIALAVAFVVPPTYVSQTLVLVDQQRVPDTYVKPVVMEDLDQRLASMKEQIFSRSRLQPIIERFELFSKGKLTIEDRLDLTRKAIGITPIRSELSRTGGLPGFFISFKADRALTAQQVCGEITSLFVSENLRDREQSAQGTTDFLKGQLEDAKHSLDEQDAKLADFQRKFIGQLPGQEQPNINMLASLDSQLEAATQALGRMQQDKAYEEAMLAQQTREWKKQESPRAAPPDPQAQLQEMTNRDAQIQKMEVAAAELESRYTPSHPDVIKLRRNIEILRAKPLEAPEKATTATNVERPEPIEAPQVQQMRAQLRALEQGIVEKKEAQDHIQQQIKTYQARVQSSPMVQEQYKELTRDYQTALQFYNDLLTKKNQSEMATDLERRQQGEQFRVMDAPNLPEEPTFPNRRAFAGGGLAAGLCLGLLLAGFMEYRDTSLRSERDISAFTNLPTLAVISLEDTDRSSKVRGKHWYTRRGGSEMRKAGANT
jgi:polysaccharide chain length determinant protein (PEP-CTERM system associated)